MAMVAFPSLLIVAGYLFCCTGRVLLYSLLLYLARISMDFYGIKFLAIFQVNDAGHGMAQVTGNRLLYSIAATYAQAAGSLRGNVASTSIRNATECGRKKENRMLRRMRLIFSMINHCISIGL
jgi:hypothetical protein